MKFKANSTLQQAVDVFDLTSSTSGEIESAGAKSNGGNLQWKEE